MPFPLPLLGLLGGAAAGLGAKAIFGDDYRQKFWRAIGLPSLGQPGEEMMRGTAFEDDEGNLGLLGKALAFGAETLTDPVTYATMGLGGLGGRAIGSTAAKQLASRGADIGSRVVNPLKRLGMARPIERELSHLDDLENAFQSQLMGTSASSPRLTSALAEAISPESAAAFREALPAARAMQWSRLPTGVTRGPGPHLVDVPIPEALPYLDLLKQEKLGRLQDLKSQYGFLERMLAGSPEPGQTPLSGLLGARRDFTVLRNINPVGPGAPRATGRRTPYEALDMLQQRVMPDFATGDVGGVYSPAVKTAFIQAGAGRGSVRHEITHGLVDAARSGAKVPLPMRAIAAMDTSESPLVRALGMIGDETLAHSNEGRNWLDKLANAYNFAVAPHPGYYEDVAALSPLVANAWKYAPIYGTAGGIGGAGLATYYGIRE